MKTILFYGNCQVDAISKIMNNILNEYNIIVIICWSTSINKEELTNIIKQSDIIITQPICENYRNTDYLDTKYILKNAKDDTNIIIFPSLYFNFYYFDYSYKKISNNSLLLGPSDYHYHGLIECYQKNNSIDYFIENYLKNSDYKSEEELNNIANSSIIELKKRENELQGEINSNNS
jgi:hypothetical protein